MYSLEKVIRIIGPTYLVNPLAKFSNEIQPWEYIVANIDEKLETRYPSTFFYFFLSFFSFSVGISLFLLLHNFVNQNGQSWIWNAELFFFLFSFIFLL